MKILPLAVWRTKSATLLHVAGVSLTEELRRELQFLCDATIKFSEVPSSLIEDSILRAYLGSEQSLKERLAEIESSKAYRGNSSATLVSLDDVSGDAAQFLAALIQHAVVRGASDLHLCPIEDGAIIKMRLDGELLIHDSGPYPRAVHDQMVARLKVLARLDPSKRHTPQDGSFSFKIVTKTVALRLSILPAVCGESAVIRLLLGQDVPALTALGFERSVLEVHIQSIQSRGGLILLTGTTGSGKTTKLYST
jgi:type II secretory ATPase GspE/PulE/Tfp pilus assembly ATPase PilB-like protein